MRVSLIGLFTIFITTFVTGQDAPYTISGDFRLVQTASGTNSGFENGVFALRSRIGVAYTVNGNSLFKARLATTFSDALEPVTFTIQPDGGGLAKGSISFDEFYYQIKKGVNTLTIGRFQHSVQVKTNASRSIMRFSSNHVNIHFFEGIKWEHALNKDWDSELVLEYQKKGHTSYNYSSPLNFNKNDHNFAAYYGLENTTRDDLNIIQKGVGLYVAPSAYQKTDGYSSYLAFVSRLAFDFPKDALQGGSIRVAGEFGQNLNTELTKGTIAVASVGVNHFNQKHDFMVELAKTGEQWLLANVYVPDADEIEFRYSYFLRNQISFDIRYRIRNPRATGSNPLLATFMRLNYKF